eukprot:gene11239-4059_t
MGNAQSESERKDLQITGYQVVRVIPDSPAFKAGLVPYFDFIISLDNCPVQEEKSDFFSNYINKSENQPLQITVYSTKLMTERTVVLIPSSTWDKTGLTGINLKLGCTIRYETVQKALECVWHVAEVQTDSPAEKSKLQKESDFIIGIGPYLFHEADDFGTWLSKNTKEPFYVYNSKTDSFRYVLVERKEDESIGCDICNGLIHQIPTREESLNQDYLGDDEGYTMKYFGIKNEPDVEKKENKV